MVVAPVGFSLYIAVLYSCALRGYAVGSVLPVTGAPLPTLRAVVRLALLPHTHLQFRAAGVPGSRYRHGRGYQLFSWFPVGYGSLRLR